MAFQDADTVCRTTPRKNSQTRGSTNSPTTSLTDESDRCEESNIRLSRRNRFRSSFHAATDMLKKYWPRTSAVGKHGSGSSVGHSEEELGRRAELRKIRHQRIKNELEEAPQGGELSLHNVSSHEYNGNHTTTGELSTSACYWNHPAVPVPTQPFSICNKLSNGAKTYANILDHPRDDHFCDDPMHLCRQTHKGTISRRHSAPLLDKFGISFADPRVYVPLKLLEPVTSCNGTAPIGSHIPANAYKSKHTSQHSPSEDLHLNTQLSVNKTQFIPSIVRADNHKDHLNAELFLDASFEQDYGPLFAPASRWFQNSQINQAQSSNLAMTISHEDFGGVDGARSIATNPPRCCDSDVESQHSLLERNSMNTRTTNPLGISNTDTIYLQHRKSISQSAAPRLSKATRRVLRNFARRKKEIRTAVTDTSDPCPQAGDAVSLCQNANMRDTKEEQLKADREGFINFLEESADSAPFYDGSNTREDLMAVPMPQFDITDRSEHGPSRSTQFADVDDMPTQWGKALAASEASRHAGITRTKSGKGELNPLTAEMQRSKGRKAEKNKASEPRMTASEEYEKRLQDRLAVKELAMDDWEAEMNASAQKAKVKSRNILRRYRPAGSDRRFPVSWSNFPSHTRQERTSTPLKHEHVSQHDFTMRIDANGKNVFYKCRVAGDRHIHDDDEEWNAYEPQDPGMLGRMQERVDQAIYRLEVHGGGSKPFEFQTSGRRGSMTTAGRAEYPELELLAVTKEGIIESRKSIVESPVSQRELHSEDSRHGQSQGPAGSLDGLIDHDYLENSTMSIADPHFYDDCILRPTMARTDLLTDDFGQRSVPWNIKRSISWSGKGSKSSKSRHGRSVSMEFSTLRGSTDGYHEELLAMEQAELNKLLGLIHSR